MVRRMGSCSDFAAVALGEPGRIVVAEPSDARLVLPDQRLERQVDADRLGRLHQRCAAQELPKIRTSVGRSGMPTFAASAAWSIRAKTDMP